MKFCSSWRSTMLEKWKKKKKLLRGHTASARRWSLLFCSEYTKDRWDVCGTVICKKKSPQFGRSNVFWTKLFWTLKKKQRKGINIIMSRFHFKQACSSCEGRRVLMIHSLKMTPKYLEWGSRWAFNATSLRAEDLNYQNLIHCAEHLAHKYYKTLFTEQINEKQSSAF